VVQNDYLKIKRRAKPSFRRNHYGFTSQKVRSMGLRLL